MLHSTHVEGCQWPHMDQIYLIDSQRYVGRTLYAFLTHACIHGCMPACTKIYKNKRASKQTNRRKSFILHLRRISKKEHWLQRNVFIFWHLQKNSIFFLFFLQPYERNTRIRKQILNQLFFTAIEYKSSYLHISFVVVEIIRLKNKIQSDKKLIFDYFFLVLETKNEHKKIFTKRITMSKSLARLCILKRYTTRTPVREIDMRISRFGMNDDVNVSSCGLSLCVFACILWIIDYDLCAFSLKIIKLVFDY